MIGSTAPAANRRPFLLTVTVDREILQEQPGLVEALSRLLEAKVEPTPDVRVSAGDFQGFTVEASSDEDEESLSASAAHRLASGIRWIEDQATEILDRVLYPSESPVSQTLRASMSLALVLSGLVRLALVAVLVLPGVACVKSSPTAPTARPAPTTTSTAPSARASSLPCQPESLACFHSVSLLTVGAQAVTVEAWSEDLPTPGYLNRWHYVLSPNAAGLLAGYVGAPHSGTACAQAVEFNDGSGGMVMDFQGYWRLDMHPTASAVSKQFAGLAGSSECRSQTFTVYQLPNGPVEILIEEPVQ